MGLAISRICWFSCSNKMTLSKGWIKPWSSGKEYLRYQKGLFIPVSIIICKIYHLCIVIFFLRNKCFFTFLNRINLLSLKTNSWWKPQWSLGIWAVEKGQKLKQKNMIYRAESAKCCSSVCMHGISWLYLPLTRHSLQDTALSSHHAISWVAIMLEMMIL